MNVRVVRFTDVTPEQLNAMVARVEREEGPREAMKFSRLEVFHDAGSGTAVVVQRYDSQADMEEAARVLQAMDPNETPGTRASVDTCEQVLDLP
jgi:uncharacterized protein (UPF0335 family)